MVTLFGAVMIAGFVSISFSLAIAQQKTIFTEEFSGPELAPSIEIINHNPRHMRFVDGKYLEMETGSLSKWRDTLNILKLRDVLPESYSIEFRIHAARLNPKQKIRLRIGDASQGIRLVFSKEKDNLEYFTIEKVFVVPSGRGFQGIVRVKSEVEPGRPFSMRLSKTGEVYLAEYSHDGRNWERVGKQRWTPFGEHVLDDPEPFVFIEAYGAGDLVRAKVLIDSLNVVDLGGSIADYGPSP